MKRLVLTVGNNMRGDDGAGPLLAEKMQREPIADRDVLDGGETPEDVLYRVRELQPDEVLVVDAADMGLEPGAIRTLSEEMIADQFPMSTHNLPLVYLIRLLKEFVPQVTFIGIQPQNVTLLHPMSLQVKEAVDSLYNQLRHQPDYEYPSP